MNEFYVKLTKLKTLIQRTDSLNVDYWVVGTLVSYPQVNSPVVILRDIRNGIKIEGILSTSYVEKIEGDLINNNKLVIKTENSLYLLEKVSKEDYIQDDN